MHASVNNTTLPAYTEAEGKLRYQKPAVALLSSQFTEGKWMYSPNEQMVMGTMTFGPSWTYNAIPNLIAQKTVTGLHFLLRNSMLIQI